jgi:hypothetical protein
MWELEPKGVVVTKPEICYFLADPYSRPLKMDPYGAFTPAWSPTDIFTLSVHSYFFGVQTLYPEYRIVGTKRVKYLDGRFFVYPPHESLGVRWDHVTDAELVAESNLVTQ